MSSTDHNGRIWNIYRSKRAVSRLDVPFGVSLMTNHVYGSKFPQNRTFGDRMGRSSISDQKFQNRLTWKLLSRSWRNVYRVYTHHAGAFVDGTWLPITNPRWRTAAILNHMQRISAALLLCPCKNRQKNRQELSYRKQIAQYVESI